MAELTGSEILAKCLKAEGVEDAETALGGSDTINVVNTGDDSNVAAIVDAFQLAMNDLVNGRPSFHDGADSPDQQFYLGGGEERRSFKNLKSYKRRKRWL